VLDQQELSLWAARFGVAPAQIRKDHLISHLLAGIGHSAAVERAVFFGGTALARTHLGDRRVSEDIDLWAESARDVFTVLADELPRYVRREYPGLRIEGDSPTMGNAVTASMLFIGHRVPLHGRCNTYL
jgi:hypothetical protein